ncbi:MAG: D-aminoacyl-tRNA deacylase [Planctomycetota bacterium]|nr:D-aminoacyl-tRNA deacylase [Planctomycetota bacterium]
MRAVVQRVSHSLVRVEEKVVGQIERGLLVLLGVEEGDTGNDMEYLAEKVMGLRVFEDHQGKMNLSVGDVGGGLLVVSQFTLLGDVRKGKRPSFVRAADPDTGDRFYREFISFVEGRGIRVETGQFRASMSVELVNEGPVTILLDSRKQF